MTTRLLRSTLLDHPVRATLYHFIQSRPGITFLDAFHALRAIPAFAPHLGFGSLAYHLHQLEHFRYITSLKGGRYRRFFQNGGQFGRDTHAIALLQTPPIPILVDALLAHPGVTQQDLTHLLPASYPATRQALSYHLIRLERSGLVSSLRRGRFKVYHVTPRLRLALGFIRPAYPSLARSPLAPSPELPLVNATGTPLPRGPLSLPDPTPSFVRAAEQPAPYRSS